MAQHERRDSSFASLSLCEVRLRPRDTVSARWSLQEQAVLPHASQSEMMPTFKSEDDLIKAVRVNIEICKRHIRFEQQRITVLRQKLRLLTEGE